MTQGRLYEIEDQTVVGFQLKDNNLFLHVRCLNETTNTTTQISVIFSSPSNIQIGSDTPAFVGMVHEDGEILHCELKDHHALLIIVWYGAKEAVPVTSVYNFDFESVQIQHH